MISIIHWISAKRRLEEMDKTVAMFGKDTPDMIKAQRDMTRFEEDYYRDKVADLIRNTFLAIGFVLLLIVALWPLYYK